MDGIAPLRFGLARSSGISRADKDAVHRALTFKTTNVLVDQRSALDARGRSLGTFASDAACPLIEVTLEPGGQYGSLSADSVTFSR